MAQALAAGRKAAAAVSRPDYTNPEPVAFLTLVTDSHTSAGSYLCKFLLYCHHSRVGGVLACLTFVVEDLGWSTVLRAITLAHDDDAVSTTAAAAAVVSTAGAAGATAVTLRSATAHPRSAE